MAKGVLYKFNASTWSKSQSKKFNAGSVSDGKVRHANASTWYDNYPMEQLYSQEFSCTWTQGYEVNTKLWAPSWGDHLYSGGNAGFRSYVGFDVNAISNFVTGAGKIQLVQIRLNLKETSLNGTPAVNFYPAQLNSAPASWNGGAINTSYGTQHTFPNKAYGGYHKNLTANHVKHPGTGVFFGAIALMPKSNTEWDWAVFNGKGSYNTRLYIEVLK